MIGRLLVANRAEIASRVFRTCRRLGIETVAVHSDADAGLPYVAEADQAVHLPGNAPGDTYLRSDLILEAARRTGADAIHPGYGFLSENADFARAVIEAGLTWVGPPPEAIEQMGSKIGAKKLMSSAGVPVLEAVEGEFPVLVKASAGGGGRGMRVVRSAADLDAEIAAAESEAASAFGDGTVFVEPYVERGRHVEVQVVGDTHGQVEVYGERDCSLQRRHQKVIEESPAPRLPEQTRETLHTAARHAAFAVSYVGAGTVEFLYDPDADRFYFLEMNTRLQVEHPVTELVHDVDLVALQIQVAEGGSCVPAGAMALAQTHDPVGHAIEARLYAEDPAADYQPQSGVLRTLELEDAPDVRVDAGFASGDTVSTFYDAMLAKVIVHAPTREQAARRLAGVLSQARIHGLTTNRDQLVAALRDPAFLAGEVSTALLADLAVPAAESDAARVAAALALAERAGADRTVQSRIPIAWRNVTSQPQTTRFDDDTSVEWYGTRDGLRVDGHGVVASSPLSVTLETDGVRTTYEVAIEGEAVDVDWSGGHVALRTVPRFVDPADAVASGSLLAPMPGTVVSVAVQVGDEVAAGAPVLVLEAMKMQHKVTAPTAGTVTQIDVEPGAQVAAGELMAVVEEEATEES